ncbi:MAG: N-acetyl-gamma-glutamyl-phosphate reductase [bacterium]
MKVSIIGATGYTGAELVKILLRHPEVEIETITSQSFAGKKISEVYPWLSTDLVCQSLDLGRIASVSSFIFVALPHGASMELVGGLYLRDTRIVDLSADFRLDHPLVYEKWYGVAHKKKNLLKQAVYGLPELYREKIKGARLVANPGCYPTSALLSLAPLLKFNLIKEDSIIVDSKSGVTGAGRKPSLKTHFPEVNENLSAYQVGCHRHIPEIEQELAKLAQKEVKITFIPHLVPLNRGILSTCYTGLKDSLKPKDLGGVFEDFYRGEPFVEILPRGCFPQVKDVVNSNRCQIGLTLDEKTHRVIVISTIDNLGKGASSQAVQNMNIMSGFEETMGLS